MNRLKRILLWMPIFILGTSVSVAQDRGEGDRRNKEDQSQGVTQNRHSRPDRQNSQENAPRPAGETRPSAETRPAAARPSTGNRPSTRTRPTRAPRSKTARPARSNGGMNDPALQNRSIGQDPNRRTFQPNRRAVPRQRDRAFQQPARSPAGSSRAPRAANLPSHTHPYDRQRLINMGVRSLPQPIRNNAAILRTDRSHSVIRFPQSGPPGGRIQASMVSPRQFNNNAVRAQMSFVIQPSFSLRLDQERGDEDQRDRSYWHNENGFSYNHYIDDWGYHWYGWYRGDQYFWTRNFNGRWWWYDPDYERWCYYQDNNWYWQDPDQDDTVYVYDNDNYISLDFNLHN